MSAASAAPDLGPAVYGTGSGPLEPADRVHVVLTTQGLNTAARGRFSIIHQTPTGLFARLSGNVDCLTVSGGTAVATGTITSGFDDLGIDPIGHRVSIAVHGQTRTVDVDVSFVSEHSIAPCTSDPILPLEIDRGGFLIRS